MRIQPLLSTALLASMLCTSAGAVVLGTGPSDLNYRFKYRNVGVRTYVQPPQGASTASMQDLQNLMAEFQPYFGPVAQTLAGRINFTASPISGLGAPYFDDAAGRGDYALVVADWGEITDVNDVRYYPAFTTTYSYVAGQYLPCSDGHGALIPGNCNSTDRMARFAVTYLNFTKINADWSHSIYHLDVVEPDGHQITFGDFLQHLVAHEFGHVLGMGHELDSGGGAAYCVVAGNRYTPPIDQYPQSTSVMEPGGYCRKFFSNYAAPDIRWLDINYPK